MVIIIKCPDLYQDFSPDQIADFPNKKVIEVWTEVKSKPHKNKTLIPWVGPRGEWSFFYYLKEDGRYLVLDTDKIHDIINGLSIKNFGRESKYLLDILTWKRNIQINSIVH